VRLVKDTNYISISASDVFLQLAPISFDASTFEIWGCLLNGARLVVPPAEIMSPAEIGSTIQKHGVSVLWLTAGLFHLMVDEELDRLKGLRRLLAGGDVLSIAHVRKALEVLGDGTLINGYGPTENTTFTCCHSITRSSTESHSIPIGRPISNTQCFILDCSLMPVPIGVRGELFTGGDGLACGYLNDPKLTAAKFIPNPFQAGALLYRTGDFARFLPDGNIEFLGRVDQQVKISGFRVELGEVESVLKLHPAVRECVVALQEYEAADKRLVAYVRLVDAAATGELRSFLRERLPAHMIPSNFVVLDAFPLMANGKLDRARLTSPEGRLPQTDESYVAPRTPMEKALVGIWCEVLGLKQIGVQDNFFELGGHSLMVVRLISKVNRRLSVSLGFPELFQNPTVEQLAGMIEEHRSRGKQRPKVSQLQEGSAESALYFIYAGSNEFRLAQMMGAGRPIFGIEEAWPSAWLHAAANNQTSALPNLEQIVAPYVAALIAEKRSSPCILAGYSFAGLMAFEAAHQFQKQGGKVEMVMLLDSSIKFPNRYHKAWDQLRQDWRQALKRLPAECTSIVKRAVQPKSWFGKENGELTGFLDEEGMPLPWELIERLYRKAMRNYRPHPLDCRGILFRTAPEDELAGAVNGSLGWENLFTRGLEIIPVTAADHVALIRETPNVLNLAREMNRRLSFVGEQRKQDPCPRLSASLLGI
jgi:thioesterase domain-containing protein/acyl carrier protein